jgi:DNA modification methylase
VKPFYADDWLTVYQGDCRAVLATLPAESVHCVVTSPPYWGLRDYGTATWEGGDVECDHRHQLGGEGATSAKQNTSAGTQTIAYRDTCGKCGATRQDSQLGLEPTPEQYVANMVAVFREVRRVLRDDGTLWLNLGDSYASKWPTRRPERSEIGAGSLENGKREARPERMGPGLKDKDLVGIPWRVAFALQADGWYLRSDIIWSKPNPMPESVTDRPTKSHEYLFLLAKSERYYFDADAVKEGRGDSNLSRAEAIASSGTDGIPTSAAKLPDSPYHAHKGARRGIHGVGTTFVADPAGRNIRSVWTIATQPYPGAHFATFPPKLVEPCIKAGTSERGVCPECGAPWRRVVADRGEGPQFAPLAIEASGALPDGPGTHRNMGGRYQKWLDDNPTQTLGWQPSCPCFLTMPTMAPIPATVLDPFAGSGTTGMVAQSLSRRAVLIDLNAEYIEQQLRRNAQTPLGLSA